MHVEHLAEQRITLYCHSGPRNFNQRNEGNSQVTLRSWKPALSWSWCISPRSQLLGGRRERGASLVELALGVHNFLPTKVPKTTALQRRQESQSRFREVRERPLGRLLNSHACVGHVSGCSYPLRFLEKSWPPLPSPWVFIPWVPTSRAIPNTISPVILLTPLWISAEQTFVFPLFFFSTHGLQHFRREKFYIAVI